MLRKCNFRTQKEYFFMKKRKNGYYETQKTFTIEGKKIQHTFYYKTKTELSEK